MSVQVFIHRYYEVIKLTLLVVLIILSVFTILSQLAQNEENRERDVANVADLAEAVRIESEASRKENQGQSELINRQFRALCIIIIETSGQEGLDKLDAESRARCENLSTEEAEEPPVSEQDSRQSQSQGNNGTSSNNTPNSNNGQPDNSQQPQSPTPPEEQNPPLAPSPPPQSIIPFVDDPVIGCTSLPLVGQTCL